MKTALRLTTLAFLILFGTAKCDTAGAAARPGRYQVVYGEIGGYTSTDGHQYGAFIKIDTVTGDTWIYRGEIQGWMGMSTFR